MTTATCFEFDCLDNDYIGAAGLALDLDNIGEISMLSRRVVHPDFINNDIFSENNVALWFLEKPFTVVKHFATTVEVIYQRTLCPPTQNSEETTQNKKKIKNQGKRRTRVDGEGAKELKEPI